MATKTTHLLPCLVAIPSGKLLFTTAYRKRKVVDSLPVPRPSLSTLDRVPGYIGLLFVASFSRHKESLCHYILLREALFLSHKSKNTGINWETQKLNLSCMVSGLSADCTGIVIRPIQFPANKATSRGCPDGGKFHSMPKWCEQQYSYKLHNLHDAGFS